MNENLEIIVRHRGYEYLIDVEDPTEPLNSIVGKISFLLGIDRIDRNGNRPIHYLARKDGGEEELLNPKVDREDKSLLDYNVKSGDVFFIRSIGVGFVYGVYTTGVKRYRTTWMDLIEPKNIYAWLGLFIGLPIAVYGAYLILMGLTAETAYEAALFGTTIVITNAFPGLALFFAGLLIVWVTKYSWQKIRY